MKNFNISNCIKEAESIEKLYLEFINLCEELWDLRLYLELTDKAKPVQRELLKRYEIWFAVTKIIVRQNSENYSEFEETYVKVKNYITFEKKRVPINDIRNKFVDTFDKQVNILHTIIPILSLKETDFKKLITADLLDSELSQAELLYKHNYYRAAGAITGVVMERYLKTLCEVNQVEIGGNDTIEPLATKLYKSDKLPDFDITLFKSIQHLASIRNKCDHPKEEPKQHEVRELIDKVKKITFLGI